MDKGLDMAGFRWLLILLGVVIAAGIGVLAFQPASSTGAQAVSEEEPTEQLPVETRKTSDPDELFKQSDYESALARLAERRTWDYDVFDEVRSYLLDSPPVVEESITIESADLERYVDHMSAFMVLEARYQDDPDLPQSIKSEIEAEFLRRLSSENPTDRYYGAAALIDAGLWKRPDIESRLLEMLRNETDLSTRLELSAHARRAGWQLRPPLD